MNLMLQEQKEIGIDSEDNDTDDKNDDGSKKSVPSLGILEKLCKK